MKHLAMAYHIQKRAPKMAKGGMAHCAHGGPAYCNMGCYADGGEVENSAEAARKSIQYEKGVDEREADSRNYPAEPKMNSMHSMQARQKGLQYEVDTDEVEGDDESDFPAFAKGGMIMHPRAMAHMVMGKKMAKGGIIDDSEDASEEATAYEMGHEDHSGGGVDNEDIDVAHTSPHDDFLSAEEDYPLDEEEGYEEGRQAKMRRKASLIDRVMMKLK